MLEVIVSDVPKSEAAFDLVGQDAFVTHFYFKNFIIAYPFIRECITQGKTVLLREAE